MSPPPQSIPHRCTACRASALLCSSPHAASHYCCALGGQHGPCPLQLPYHQCGLAPSQHHLCLCLRLAPYGSEAGALQRCWCYNAPPSFRSRVLIYNQNWVLAAKGAAPGRAAEAPPCSHGVHAVRRAAAGAAKERSNSSQAGGSEGAKARAVIGCGEPAGGCWRLTGYGVGGRASVGGGLFGVGWVSLGHPV